jgi:DNA-binding transcriptional LysR family regulator
MDLRQLEVFAGVYELRSFSRTASALRLTQSTVSEHVRLLEEELGTRLFDRLSRETVPTRAGELLYGYARQMLALRSQARQAVDSFLGQVTGTLLIGASTIPGEYVLPAVIGRFRERHPRVAITLQISDTRGTVQAVLDGLVDAGVVGADPGNRGLESRALMPDELVLVIPPGHPWSGRSDATLDDLKTQPLIVREAGSGSRQALERALEAGGRSLGEMQVIAEMGSTSAIKQAVKAGVGVSVMSSRAAEDECRHGLLACVKLKDLSVTRQFYVVTHANRSRAPICRAFLDFLADEFPG